MKYDHVDGKYLYNCYHLTGYHLTAENANEENLGPKNVDRMLPFENLTEDYIQETGNHVLCRFTPVYEGNALVSGGVEFETWSVEDEGEGSVSM